MKNPRYTLAEGRDADDLRQAFRDQRIERGQRLRRLAGVPDQLIENVWGYDFAGNERTLDVHINRLRERFPEERHSFRIRTIRGLGYRLEVEG